MRQRINFSAVVVVLLVGLYTTAFGGIIPTIPAPDDPAQSSQEAPTPTPTPTAQPAQTSEEPILDWLLGLLNIN